ncbi:unnamed protein product [Mytilus edulis]|uniref:Mutator-like transposase domain-containing protein n=1 Tax=Mytilus edulis TaxID=6550 RepID=A0A8S3UTS6_MYTED|nr:unnamed protein product [Mytilus edulis]
MHLIGDGDSSVYAQIMQNVPVWGKYVKKIECSNHVCKCVRSNLEKLVNENPEYKGKGKLTKQIRVRIVSSIRCAIRMRSLESDKRKAIKNLEHDITNCINHIYGDHSRCSDFCKANLKDKVQHKWSPQTWEETTSSVSGHYYTTLYSKRLQCLKNNTKTKGKKEIKSRRYKRKMKSAKESTAASSKKHYGPEAIQVEADISSEELDKRKTTVP